jgi:uncharacterized protein
VTRSSAPLSARFLFFGGAATPRPSRVIRGTITSMFVAIARFTLRIEGSHSLKEKRAVVRRAVDRVQQQFRVVMSEVLDTWQRADLAFSIVQPTRARAEDAVGSILAFVDSLGLAVRSHARHEIVDYGEDWYGEPAGDPSDLSWVPAAWREEASK